MEIHCTDFEICRHFSDLHRKWLPGDKYDLPQTILEKEERRQQLKRKQSSDKKEEEEEGYMIILDLKSLPLDGAQQNVNFPLLTLPAVVTNLCNSLFLKRIMTTTN